jgi:hypothetical protein
MGLVERQYDLWLYGSLVYTVAARLGVQCCLLVCFGGLGRWSLVRVHPFGGGEAFAIPLVFPSV